MYLAVLRGSDLSTGEIQRMAIVSSNTPISTKSGFNVDGFQNRTDRCSRGALLVIIPFAPVLQILTPGRESQFFGFHYLVIISNYHQIKRAGREESSCLFKT
jgi:hypothetical protein